MRKSTRYLGLDVHAQMIPAAIAEGRKKVRNFGQLPNRPEAFQRKPSGKVATAIARELVGFVWAIGYSVETQAIRKAA